MTIRLLHTSSRTIGIRQVLIWITAAAAPIEALAGVASSVVVEARDKRLARSRNGWTCAVGHEARILAS